MSRKPKNWKNADSRWGPGKVHLLIKVPGGAYLACLGIAKTNYHSSGKETDEPVTCKKCLR